jgi:hypothetical protein
MLPKPKTTNLMYHPIILVEKSTNSKKGHNITINLLIKHVEVNKVLEK